MVSGKYSAVAGAVSREQALANIANNLANVNSTGYKRMSVSFESLLQGEKQIGDAQGINYNRVKQNVTDFSSGPLRDTGNVFDLAISGSGFFKVLGPEGPMLTRNGAFSIDQDGILKTHEGYPVLSDGDTPVEVGETGGSTLSINRYGTISLLDNQGNREEISRIAVVDVDDASQLKRRDGTHFTMEANIQETPIEEPTIVSGSLESANVNMVEEMTKMMDGHRLYEIYHKVLRAYSTISEKQENLGTIS